MKLDEKLIESEWYKCLDYAYGDAMTELSDCIGDLEKLKTLRTQLWSDARFDRSLYKTIKLVDDIILKSVVAVYEVVKKVKV